MNRDKDYGLVRVERAVVCPYNGWTLSGWDCCYTCEFFKGHYVDQLEQYFTRCGWKDEQR